MKKTALFLIVLTVCLFAGCGGNGTIVIDEGAENVPTETPKPEKARVLGVNDIRFDPLSFTGEITINGINVGLYQRDESIFFLMDTDELLACKNMQCGAFQLPVIYKGDNSMPELADEVNITGTWVKYEEDGQTVDIFEATVIDSKRNVMSILTS